MNLIAKYLEKDPENAENEPPTFEAPTSRLERLRQDGSQRCVKTKWKECLQCR